MILHPNRSFKNYARLYRIQEITDIPFLPPVYSISSVKLPNITKKQFNVTLDPEKEVVCTIGSKEGISHLCLGLLDPGETALVPNPAFPIHIHAVNLAGGNVISVPLTEDEKFLPNLMNTAKSLIPGPR